MKTKWVLILIFPLWILIILLGLAAISQHKQLNKINLALESEAIDKLKSHDDLGKEIQASVDQSRQDVRDAVAGIYRFFDNFKGTGEQMDLRSDGTGLFGSLFGHDEKVYQNQKISWTWSNSTILVNNLTFNPEGDDLIDNKGNRWFKIH